MKEFETEELIIRKFKVEDSDEIYEDWVKAKKLEDIVGFKPIGGLNEVKRIIMSSIKDSESGEPRWVIQEKKSKKLIGYIATDEISRKNQICKIIFSIDGFNAKRKEYLKDAIQKICDYLLNEDEFKFVYTKVYNSESEKSKFEIEILKEIGMKLEGNFRRIRINERTNKPEDLLVFTIMREDLEKAIS